MTRRKQASTPWNNALHLTAPLGAVVARLAQCASCSLSLAPAPQVNAVFARHASLEGLCRRHQL